MEYSEIDLSLDLFPRGISPDRTPGVHLTDIIKDLYVTSGMGARDEKWDARNLWLAGEVGFMWEEILSGAMKSRLPWRIGEIEEDGILMSPDGVYFEEGELWEYKATWRSSNKPPYENWKWMTQVKSYLYALRMNVVVMPILYIWGDWRGTGPQFKGHRMGFSDYEKEETWEMVVSHARKRGMIP